MALVVPLAGQSLPRASRPEDVGLSSERLQRLTTAFNDYVKANRLPGAVVLIARRGKVAYLQAFGARDRESASPMREDAIFRIASQSKAPVSVAVMILQEEGKLLIGDPVGALSAGVRQDHRRSASRGGGGYDVVPAKRPITIRDLLTHTAGISYGDGPAADQWKAAGITGWYFADRDEPIGGDHLTPCRAALRRAARREVGLWLQHRHPRGARRARLGPAARRVPAHAHLRAARDARHAASIFPKDKADRLATVYSVAGDGALTRTPDTGGMISQGAYVDGPRKSFSGGAGLLSTASDYARFLQMLLNGGELEGKRILSRPIVKLMTDQPHRRHRVPARSGLRARVLGGRGRRRAGPAWVAGGIRMGRRLPLHLLGRPSRTAGGGVHDAGHPVRHAGRSEQAARARLSGDCELIARVCPQATG